MPELPEVEVVRRGVASWVAGRRIAGATVLRDRSVRRHLGGPVDFAAVLAGATPAFASRRGKFLWLPLVGRDDALVVHLGMSGQLLVEEAVTPDQAQLRVRVDFADGGRQLRFVDQRTFGWLAVEPLVPDDTSGRIPVSAAHIARDPIDPRFDALAVSRAMRARRTGVKRALLDQTLLSGVGNIYADEALWRARLHWAKPTDELRAGQVRELLGQVREVMTESLAAGGTSFDSLYVDVNGRNGYFQRGLRAYGRHGKPCHRCGTPIRREAFANRSSYRCPRCQRTPRRPRW